MLGLSSAEYYVLFVAGVALVLIISNRIAPDLVALMVLLALGVSGIITPQQALSGFSRPAVITILGLFVITAALERTGVVRWIANRLARLAGNSENRLIIVFMLAGASLSIVMNNIAAGAVLLPAAVRVANNAKVRPSKILMPLAFGTLVGGMATYFTTANIILSSNLQNQGQRGLNMLDFLPVGGAMVLTGCLYMVFIGRRLLPDRQSVAQFASPTQDDEDGPDLRETYQLDDRLWEVEVRPQSPLIGKSLRESQIGSRLGITVMAIWHNQEAKIAPAPDERIEEQDMLLVLGREERVTQLEAEGVHLGRDGHHLGALADRSVQLTEVIVAPRSPVLGDTLRSLRFRDKFGLTTVAIWRGGRSYRTDVGQMRLQAGDALLMVGPQSRVRQLAREPGYILPNEVSSEHTARPREGILTAIITAIVLTIAAIGLVPTPEAMLAGMVALVLTGMITMEDAYRAVEWRVIFLIAGMLPIGEALMETGLADRIGNLLTGVLAPYGSLVLIGGLYLFTVAITQVIGGQVAALVVGPIAVTAAIQANVNPPAVAVAVAMACSASFLTPIAHPVNLLMMNPGGYRSSDFLKVGSGMTLVCFVTLLIVMPLLWNI